MEQVYPHQRTLEHEIARVGRLLYERGLIVAGDGNISARLGPNRVLMTPAGLCKGRLEPRDMVVVDLEGALIRSAPDRRPSTERTLHLLLYQARPDVQAVVHAHPPTAVAATMAGVSMNTEWLPETILTLGAIPTAPYALTGTAEMYEAIEPFVAEHDALLLSHHGALTVGTTLAEALGRMEQVEHSARILLAAHQFGGVRPLPPTRVYELRSLREQMRARRANEEHSQHSPR
jgi:L-fuculose-phosphate aldolase